MSTIETQALIPLLEGETEFPVNARDLHAFLMNRDKFATWIKARIEKYEFAENQDFVSFSEKSEKPTGGAGIEPERIVAEFRSIHSILSISPGLDANQAYLGAIQRTDHLLGTRILEMLPKEAVALPSPHQCAELRPTALQRGLVLSSGPASRMAPQSTASCRILDTRRIHRAK